MQFVPQGPDIPDRLLQAHEDGRVVFFCGAGVSCPAGLPTFDGLVEKLHEATGVKPSAVERAACKAGQYDTAVGLLEARAQGGRPFVRRHLARILTPDLGLRDATSTHEALLTLARDRDGRTRLVTTNFDQLFEVVIKKNSLTVKSLRAPALPVPKRRWDGLVYLHGLLTAEPSESDLQNLVISSGDFGLAYLTERWAARFVSELFHRYTVCFVGYSIGDPVMRYVMDALAADRSLGESPPEVFAFACYSKGKERECKEQWTAKNVTAILYRAHRRHAYLHRTLAAWSRTYRDGVRAKERIINEYAGTSPVVSTKQDDFAGRVLWALSDPSGRPAKRFADFEPVPSLDWLKLLSKERFRHADLTQFGVSPRSTVDDSLAFSLVRRPAPSERAPWMTLVDSRAGQSGWDPVMAQIARWLPRHVGDPCLFLWVCRQGGVLHPRMKRCVASKLEELARLEHAGDRKELDRLRENPPHAIPSPKLRKLWRLLLAGRVKTSEADSLLVRWVERFERDGLTTTLRLELRDLLAPRVEVSGPLPWSSVDEQEEIDETERERRALHTEVVLSVPDARTSLKEIAAGSLGQEALPVLLEDFTRLLRDALDLLFELGDADEKSDRSFVDQPSICEHRQNLVVRDDGWAALIELARDSWLATRVRCSESARISAESWQRIPYPVFQRLAFFAATFEDVIPRQQALDWLLADRGWWLWSPETLRESVRLLLALVPSLDGAGLTRLEQAVLDGPPRDMYRADIKDDAWERLRDREIWLRCAKVASVDQKLSAKIARRLDELAAQYPDWRLADDDRDEFPFWIGGGEDGREFVATSRDPDALVEWIKENADEYSGQRDDWTERCRKDLDGALTALSAVADEDIWPRRLWREALDVWSDEKLIGRSWSLAAAVVARMPERDLHAIRYAVSYWLRAASSVLDDQEDLLLDMCGRILELKYEERGEEELHDPVDQAINHPVGRVTEALLRWWRRSPLEDGQGLRGALRSRFSTICDTERQALRHGRVLLSTYAITLFRVDRDWTTRFLLPLFEWKRSTAEARSAWTGFLRSARLYRPLIEAIKPAFLETACRYQKLGWHGARYTALLTYAALGSSDVFTTTELAKATAKLPPEGRDRAAETLVQALKGAGAQAPEFWRNRAVPYLDKIWPSTTDVASDSIAERFAWACVAAKDAFPEALDRVRPWLQRLNSPQQTVTRLRKATLHETFPNEALDLLDRVIRDDSLPLPGDLVTCLDEMKAARPELEDDPRFWRLRELVRTLQ